MNVSSTKASPPESLPLPAAESPAAPTTLPVSISCIDPTLLDLVTEEYARRASNPARVKVGLVSTAALRGEVYQPKVGNQLFIKARLHSKTNSSLTVLADSGAGSCFVDESFACANNLPVFNLAQRTIAEAFDGTQADDLRMSAYVPLNINGHTNSVLCFVTKHIGGASVILGTPWFAEHEPTINWKSHMVTFHSEYCHMNCLPKGLPVTAHSSIHRKEEPPDHGGGIRYYNNIEVAVLNARAMNRLMNDPSTDSSLLTQEDIHNLTRSDDEIGADLKADFTHRPCSVAAFGAKTLDSDHIKFRDKLDQPPPSTEEIKAKIPDFLHHHADAFDPREADKLPPRRDIDHEVNLIPGSRPTTSRLRGMTRQEAEACKLYVYDMMGKGHIRRSKSEFSAPLLVARKPGGGLRICVDYRGLNEITVKNRNSPPLIRDLLNRISKACWFSKVDVIAAFNKIRVKEGHEKYTAFLTSFGLFEYTVLPFGLCNAPATFQAYINEVLHEHLDDFCVAYLDDILIYSESEDDHKRHLDQVISKLKAAGLWLDIFKSEFMVKEVKFLGVVLTTDGIKMDPEKVQAVQDWATPTTIKHVQEFVGFANFYRRFIDNFSRLIRPLMDLIPKVGGKQLLPWSEKAAKAFADLKLAFTTAPVLAHFDPDLETVVETDASDFVYAAVLSQVQRDGSLRPVAFLSKKMSPAETNYEIYDKELLAIVRAFEEWRPELAGTDDTVTVLTDHKGLEYFKTKKQLNRRQMRWAEFLSEFNFKVKYRPGHLGEKPDALTRRAGDLPTNVEDARLQHQQQTLLSEERFHKTSHNAVRLANILLCELSNEYSVVELAAMMIEMAEGTLAPDYVPLAPLRIRPVQHDNYDDLPGADDMDVADLITALYPKDQAMTDIMDAKERGDARIPHYLIQQGVRLELADVEVHVDPNLEGQERLDARRLYKRNHRVYNLLYVPFSDKLRTRIIKEVHDSPVAGGHSGRNVLYERLAQWYYWQAISDTVAQFCNNCIPCRRAKPDRTAKQSLLHPMPVPSRYWHDISVDFITPLPASTWCGRTYTSIMVVVDRMTKKTKFIPMENLEVPTVVDAFIEYVWREEGFPRTIVSDRGKQFVSHFWTRLCQRMGATPKLSSSFHPETDGQTERANTDLKAYLRQYVNYQQDDWARFLPFAEFENNSSIKPSTGLSPFMATKSYNPRNGFEPAHVFHPHLHPAPEQLPAGHPAPRQVHPPEPRPIPDFQPSNPAIQLPADTTPSVRRTIQDADDLWKNIERLREYLRSQLVWSREQMRKHADRHRNPAPQYKEGDWVMLDARNIKTTRPAKSLDWKKMGPFQIEKIYDHAAYKLDLPEPLKALYPAFHPWLLHPFDNQPLPGQNEVQPPQEIELDDDGIERFPIIQLLDSKIDRRRRDPLTGERGLLMYKVEWDWPEQTDLWQPYNNIRSRQMVDDFHRRNPRLPGPHPTFDDYDTDDVAAAILWVAGLLPVSDISSPPTATGLAAPPYARGAALRGSLQSDLLAVLEDNTDC